MSLAPDCMQTLSFTSGLVPAGAPADPASRNEKALKILFNQVMMSLPLDQPGAAISCNSNQRAAVCAQVWSRSMNNCDRQAGMPESKPAFCAR